jgi:general stress protein YciG
LPKPLVFIFITSLKQLIMKDNTRNQSRTGSKKSSARGFAAMDQEKQHEIASKGGRAAHQQRVAHEWTSEEARAAGKKGRSSSRRAS